jgi:hypothetical protein
VAASDHNRVKILEKRNDAIAAIQAGDAATSIKLFTELLDYLTKENLDPLFQEPYEILTKIYWAMGDTKEAMKYANLRLDTLDIFGSLHPANRTADLENLVKELVMHL